MPLDGHHLQAVLLSLLTLAPASQASAAQIADSHYNASKGGGRGGGGRQRLCKAYAGDNFTYSPLFLPRGVGLLHRPPRVDESRVDTYLPVMHTSVGGPRAGRAPVVFYYLAVRPPPSQLHRTVASRAATCTTPVTASLPAATSTATLADAAGLQRPAHLGGAHARGQ